MIRLTITLPENIYKQVKERAKQQYRSISNQIVYEITNYFSAPGYPFTPSSPAPIVFPGPGIPEEPYRITLSADTTQPGPDLAPAPEPEVSKYIKEPGVVTFPPEPKYEPISAKKLEQVEQRLQPHEYKNTKLSIEDYEVALTDPENKYYKKIKQHCVNSCETKELLDMLSHPDPAYIKKNYKSIIYAALEIPGTHDLSQSEWSEIAGYFK